MKPFDPVAYVAVAAPAAGIALSHAERLDVAAQLERIHALARLVLEFELMTDHEPAGRFEP